LIRRVRVGICQVCGSVVLWKPAKGIVTPNTKQLNDVKNLPGWPALKRVSDSIKRNNAIEGIMSSRWDEWVEYISMDDDVVIEKAKELGHYDDIIANIRLQPFNEAGTKNGICICGDKRDSFAYGYAYYAGYPDPEDNGYAVVKFLAGVQSPYLHHIVNEFALKGMRMSGYQIVDAT